MAKITSVFGKGGTGKTTIAISLAECLNSLNYKTLLISSETRFGILQRRLNTDIEKSKSMYFGFLKEFKDKSFYKRLRENLYITSLADEDDITSWSDIEESIIQNSIDEMNLDFEHIIVDCTDRATDELSYHFLKNSDHIINVVESSVDGILFQNAHKELFESDLFKGKTINALNKHDEGLINFTTVEKNTQSRYEAIYKFSNSVIENNTNFEQNKSIQRISENLILSEIEKEDIIESENNDIKMFFRKLRNMF